MVRIRVSPRNLRILEVIVYSSATGRVGCN